MKPIVIALSLSVSSLGAIAGEATIFDDSFTSVRTRAEVRAEVIDALARGERLSYGEAQIEAPRRVTSTLDRATVLAEARAALLRGDLNDGEATQRGLL